MALYKTSATPLAALYALLIVYASLYPFEPWRDQGIAPWSFVTAPLPRYWTGFDVAANLAGYIPLGLLVGVALARSGAARTAWLQVALAGAGGVLLSFTLEMAQSYLTVRVPSNLDWGLNSAGALAGALLAAALSRGGALERWRRTRERWFTPNARGALVLLATWPAALLFPATTPFGLGQVFERAEAELAVLLADTPFIDWMPLRQTELQPLLPATQTLCVALGLLVPVWLAYGVIRERWRRLLALLGIAWLGCAVTALSAALSFGPSNGLAWLTEPVQAGIATALVAGVLTLAMPPRAGSAWLILVLAVQLVLVNQASAGVYLEQALLDWEQGRFIRFHGLAQWLGWLWPFAALALVLQQASARRDA